MLPLSNAAAKLRRFESASCARAVQTLRVHVDALASYRRAAAIVYERNADRVAKR